MKNVINNFYKLFPSELYSIDNGFRFFIKDYEYLLLRYFGKVENLKVLADISNRLYYKKVYVNTFVSTIEGSLYIDVDNEMSCENLQKMAKVMDLSCQVSKEGNVFRLVMAKQAEAKAAPAVDDSYIVVVSSQFVGQGDDTLGTALMKSFIYTLTEAEVLPECMILKNTR